jgi:hypothetical protein
MPTVTQSKLHFDDLFRAFCGIEGSSNPLDRGSRSVPFSIGGGTFEKSGNLPQLLAKLLFSLHWINVSRQGGIKIQNTWDKMSVQPGTTCTLCGSAVVKLRDGSSFSPLAKRYSLREVLPNRVRLRTL